MSTDTITTAAELDCSGWKASCRGRGSVRGEGHHG